MPILNFVDVRLLIDDEIAPEYDDPNNPDSVHHAKKYGLAEAGQSFTVEVTHLKGFQLEHAPYIVSKMYCDMATKRVRQRESAAFIPYIQQTTLEKMWLGEHRRRIAKDAETDQWYKYNYVFGPLQHAAPLTSNAHSSARTDRLGSIGNKFGRARRVPIPPRQPSGNLPSMTIPVTPSVLRERGITSNIQWALILHENVTATDKMRTYEPYKMAKPRGPENFDYIPVSGDIGKTWNFKFLYRSRDKQAALKQTITLLQIPMMRKFQHARIGTLQPLSSIWASLPALPARFPPTPPQPSPTDILLTRAFIRQRQRELAALRAHLQEQEDRLVAVIVPAKYPRSASDVDDSGDALNGQTSVEEACCGGDRSEQR